MGGQSITREESREKIGQAGTGKFHLAETSSSIENVPEVFRAEQAESENASPGSRPSDGKWA